MEDLRFILLATGFIRSAAHAKHPRVAPPALTRYHQIETEGIMDLSNTPALRRSEDIALDLLKFLASHTNLKPGPASPTPGFGVASTPKNDEAITQLLELYARCRKAVETPVASK